MSRDIRGMSLRQSETSYHRSMADLRARAQGGVPLKFYDSTAVGDKNTECTLGLCDDSIQDTMDGVYRGGRHACPHDSRVYTSSGDYQDERRYEEFGCFYKCHVFQTYLLGRGNAAQRVIKATEYLTNENVVSNDKTRPGWRDHKHPNGNPVWAADGTLLTDDGNRSIFDDVDQ